MYKEAGNTHILLTNSALSSGDNCFWKKKSVMLPGAREAAAATAWEQYDKKVVKIADLSYCKEENGHILI